MYKILKSFKGSPDGFTVIAFEKDAVVGDDQLSGDLLEVALKEKWVTKDKESTSKQAAADKAEAGKAI